MAHDRQWLCQQEFRAPLAASTRKALARLDGVSFRTSYGEAFRHPSLRNVDLSQPPQAPRSEAGSASSSSKARRLQMKRYVTTYSDSYLPYLRQNPPQPKASLEQAGPAHRVQEKIEKPEEKYRYTVAQAEPDDKPGGRMQMDHSATPAKGSMRPIELVAGVKSNFVGGPPPIYWKSEARASFTVDVHGESAAQKYGLPTQPAPLAKFMKG
ncbi:PDE8A [Symbiodinium natans]|uniref:PDE8A protein n=1 Tax=Symbiodinium natans TaxID=878477 RepID=A0A812IGW3_9DINO|nr:PDE8A [Symbiodinium natans]